MRKTREIAARTTKARTAQTALADTPPTDAPAEDVATRVMALIDQIQALIPGFIHFDTNDAKRVANVARYAKDLIPDVIATVTALPPVGGVNTFDTEEGAAALAFDVTMQPVVRRLTALTDGVAFTVDSRLARSATQALSTYAWAKRHVKGPDGVALRPYLDQMARTMKKTLNRRKPTPPPKGAQGFLAPNLAQATTTFDDEDLPDDFRKALEEAVKD